MESLAVPPTTAEYSTNAFRIVGATPWTVSMALPLVVVPPEVVTCTRYSPELLGWASASPKVEFVAPANAEPLKNHWYTNGPVPATVTTNAALDPAVIVRSRGGLT